MGQNPRMRGDMFYTSLQVSVTAERRKMKHYFYIFLHLHLHLLRPAGQRQ